MRLERGKMFMLMAQVVAKRGTCNRAQHGAVIVQDNRVVSTGYNGAPSGLPHCSEAGCEIGPEGGCIRTVHAEANAIAFAAKHGISCWGSVMYVTGEPCLRCAQLIVNSGIQAVYCLGKPGSYRDQRGIDLLKAAQVEVFYMPDVFIILELK